VRALAPTALTASRRAERTGIDMRTSFDRIPFWNSSMKATLLSAIGRSNVFIYLFWTISSQAVGTDLLKPKTFSTGPHLQVKQDYLHGKCSSRTYAGTDLRTCVCTHPLIKKGIPESAFGFNYLVYIEFQQT
jgi:hypothetical protein